MTWISKLPSYAQEGLLLTGPDPTGNGGTMPGFGDQRGVELLVEAGFTPVEAIKIATWNGAHFMGKQESIGSIARRQERRPGGRKGESGREN